MKLFFNFRDRNFFIKDTGGAVFESLSVAQRVAEKTVGDIVGKLVLKGEKIGAEALEIRRDDGEVLAIAPFKKAIKL